MRENTDQKNSEYGHFLRSEGCTKWPYNYRVIALKMTLISDTNIFFCILWETIYDDLKNIYEIFLKLSNSTCIGNDFQYYFMT